MNKRLYVGNLAYTADESELETLFADGGRQVTSVRIMNDKATGQPRGFGFVEMATVDDAQKAIDALNGVLFMGRAITVIEARDREKIG